MGPATLGRTRWLAYDPVVHADSSKVRRGRMDCRIKSGNDNVRSVLGGAKQPARKR
jgi:hypothetical protein